ncbi:MAG: hypothetical protein ACTHON_09390 [Humibacter sp.]
MGFFSKINEAFGGTDSELMNNGIPGVARITSLVPSGGTVQIAGGLVERTCDLQLMGMLNGAVPYAAAARQRLPEVYLAQIAASTVAVRVDPNNAQRVAIAVGAPLPEVRLAQSTGPGTAAYIRETGRDGTAVIVAFTPLGYMNYLGYPMHAFTWTVVDGAPQPYQTQSASAVPPEALPLLYPGSKVHVKIGAQPHEVVADFDKGAATTAG